MPRPRLLIVAFLALLFLLCLELFYATLEARFDAQRGVWFPGEPLPPPSGAATPLGATVQLEQYTADAALDQALIAAGAMGLGWLRQELPWDAIEPERGRFEWGAWDRVIGAAHGRGFQLILVLNRAPAWARQATEQDNPLAPPASADDFARFARAAAERYGPQVVGWQVWDEPNLQPHWGTEVLIEPAQYARFLAAAAPAIRAGDPDAIVATAGLGPTGEPGGFNMSEARFLQGLYDAGGSAHFDAVALKPYGFWGLASERIFQEGRLNFDRVLLAREVMEAHGDAATPVWFVEGGWAALPALWQGDPPPWGSDRAGVQQERIEEAIQRTALEWPWAQVIALQLFQPAAPPTDPRWGLALRGPDNALTPLGASVQRMGTDFWGGARGAQARAEWETRLRPALQGFDRALWLLGGLLVALAARGAWHLARLPWPAWGERFRRLPEGAQIGALAALALLFYTVDSRLGSFALLAALGVLVAWCFDLGLAAVAFSMPFFLLPKSFGGPRFAMVELLTLLCAAVWLGRGLGRAGRSPRSLAHALRAMVWPQDGLDWAVVAFVAWAGLSVFFTEQIGLALREFRVVVLEAALWFWLIRRAGLSEGQQARLVDALVASATGVALLGLVQWLFTENIITAEGVRRVRSVYGSPNNLALLLERALPLAGAVALFAPPSRRRWLYAAAVPPLGLALLLTFSRGALALGVPAAALWLAWWGGRRARLWLGAAAVVAVLVLLPFAATERLASTTDLGGGTWAIRVSLWRSTVAMLRDHPLLGVGLDNFLYAYDRYRLPEAWREPDLSHPHQLVLHFWVALGVPGLLLLFWQQAAFWRRWARAQRRLRAPTLARGLLIGLGASMAATLAHGMIDNSFFLVDLAFFWMATLALVATMSRPPHPAPPDG